jgi:hypothetical protein
MSGYIDGCADIGIIFRQEPGSASPLAPAPADPAPCQGKVSYLGGHQYQTSVPVTSGSQSQGTRLFLNALFEAQCVTGQ